MPTYTGTTGDNSWNLITPGTFTLDGLAGVDTLNLGTSLRSSYNITQASDGAVHIDSISGASAALHATLYNMEVLTFNSGRDVLDLRILFGSKVPPTVSITDNTPGTAIGDVSYLLTFSETITGLAANDFTVSNGSVVSVSGSGGSYSVIAAPAANTEGTMSLTLNAASVTDASGNTNAATAAPAQPIDTKPPIVNSITPANQSAGVAVGSDIVFTFSEAIQKGAGSITLLTDRGTVSGVYDAATSPNLSISGSTLTINPTADLSYSTGYKVEFATGTIKDLAGNSYAGTSSYGFTTLVNPANQYIVGTASNDTLTGGAGNDTIDGGAGIDTAVFSGSSTGYWVTYDALSSTYSVKDTVSSRDGTDKLISIELLQFSDGVKQLATSDALSVERVYQALFGKAPSSTTFNQSLATIAPSGSAFDWAKVEASGLSALSDSAFSTLVLNNMSINNTSLTATATFGTSQQTYDSLQQALADYLRAAGSANRGVVVAQFGQILAGYEGETVFGVYGTAATAFDRQVASDLANSINTQNSTEVVAVPVFNTGTTSAIGGDFDYMLAMGSYSYQISGFGSGDKIISPAGVSGTLVNASPTDGVASIQYVSGGQTVSITLTGLTTAQDSALHGTTDLNTVFGLGVFI